MTLRSSALSGVRVTGGATLVGNLLKLCQLVVLAQVLPPSDFGLMAMVMLYIGFTTLIAEMGIASAVVRDQSMAPTIVSTLFWVGCFSGLGMFYCSWLVAPLLAGYFDQPSLEGPVKLAGLIFLMAPVSQMYRALHEKQLSFGYIARTEMAGNTMAVGCSIALALLGQGVLALVWGMLAGQVVVLIGLVWHGWRNWKPMIVMDIAAVREPLTFGLHLIGQRAINFVTGNIDFLVVGSVFGASALGFYSLAYHLCNVPSAINTVFARVFFPVFSRLQHDAIALQRAFMRFQQYAAIVNVPLLVCLLVAAPVLVQAIFGSAWRPAVPLIQLLSIVGLLRSLGGTVGPLLLAKGRSDLGLRWSVLAVLIQAPAIWAGSLLGDPTGVAAAFALAQCLLFMLNYRILIRNLLGPCWKTYWAAIAPALLMGVVMGGVMLLGGQLAIAPLAVLVIELISGGAVFAAMVWRFSPRFLSDGKMLIAGK